MILHRDDGLFVPGLQGVKEKPRADLIRLFSCGELAEYLSAELGDGIPADWMAWLQEPVKLSQYEPVASYWIPLGHRPGYLKHPYSEDFKCAACGYEQYTVLTLPPAVCPHCHAAMKGNPYAGIYNDQHS